MHALNLEVEWPLKEGGGGKCGVNFKGREGFRMKSNFYC